MFPRIHLFGDYNLTVEKEGYYKESIDINITKDNINDPKLLNIHVCEALKPNQFRAVLKWGNTPKDLDASIWIGKGKEVIDYGNKKNLDGTASKDISSEDGNSIETITFLGKSNDLIQYFVTNASNETTFDSSNATVTLYQGNQQPIVTKVPPNHNERIWNVFNVDKGVVKFLNLFKNKFIRRFKKRLLKRKLKKKKY